MQNRTLRVFFLVFVASGFAGLIYESLWTHYLKLFLGHAAYAQALVLAVFMGGMALGSFLCARYSGRFSRLLIGYAVVETIIGICAVLFHPIYVKFIDLAYQQIIPSLGSPLAVAIFKWTASTLLILPQSILLGMTFPLMTTGLVRRFPQLSGSIIAMLYFTNSIGAAVGVLASGFLLIGWVALPGTMVIAGFINLIVAAVVWLEEKRAELPVKQEQGARRRPVPAAEMAETTGIAPLFAISLLTGLSSFIYEIGWIRMLSLVLGSSTHAFELMLSAFIMGLAFGGLWIRRRIDSLPDPRRYLAIVQIAMGILAMATLPVYGGVFNVMSWLINHLPQTALGYTLYNITSHSIALIIMVPATFCAGMTLPLITNILLHSRVGEKSIGAVYGFNTIGSILGVFIAVHLAMPMLGLKGTILLGAAIDMALGIGLLWMVFPTRRIAYLAAACSALLVAAPAYLVRLDQNKMASGVFRRGELIDPKEQQTIYHRDGKTATVSITRTSLMTAIRTNGKPDAAIQVSDDVDIADDQPTMAIAGAIGTILNPDVRTAAVIGWGSGMTTNVLLAAPNIERVDTIEIEPLMVEAAKHFGARVKRAYEDPRGHVQIEDAKSYFSYAKKKYDVIISEPSNPWVSGVASLFTKEFYARIPQYLNKDGFFIQWLQLYEIDMDLVASIMRALSPYFSDYAIYATNAADILIVARPTGLVPAPSAAFLDMPELKDELRRININGIQDLNIRLIGTKSVLDPLFASYPITPNSDYAPVVDLYAVRSRFYRMSVGDVFHDLRFERLPIMQMLGRLPVNPDASTTTYSYYPKSKRIHFSRMLYEYLLSGRWSWDRPDKRPHEESLRNAIITRQVLIKECSSGILSEVWWKDMLYTVANMMPYLTDVQQKQFFRVLESPSCNAAYTQGQRGFLSLIRAVSQLDGARMAASANTVLNNEKRLNPDVFEYVLSAGMLGSLATGDIEGATTMWQKYGKRLPPQSNGSIVIRLLVAHMSKMRVEARQSS